MSEEPVLGVDDIQGMIVPGYRKPAQNLLHFRIADVASARSWLASLGDQLTSTSETQKQHRRFKALTARLGREPRTFNAVFCGCALSASGLRQLVGAPAVEAFADESFKVGLASRSGTLGDPATGLGSPAEWVVGGSANPIDIMLVVAGDEGARVERATQALLLEDAVTSGLSNIHIDRGSMGFRANKQEGTFDGTAPAIQTPIATGKLNDVESGDWLADMFSAIAGSSSQTHSRRPIIITRMLTS